MALLPSGDLQRFMRCTRWEKRVRQQVQPPLVPSPIRLAETWVSATRENMYSSGQSVRAALALNLPKDVGVSQVSSGAHQPAVLARKALAYGVLPAEN